MSTVQGEKGRHAGGQVLSAAQSKRHHGQRVGPISELLCMPDQQTEHKGAAYAGVLGELARDLVAKRTSV
eukprot:5089229-Pleurochrysis_carterae.AAC.1